RRCDTCEPLPHLVVASEALVKDDDDGLPEVIRIASKLPSRVRSELAFEQRRAFAEPRAIEPRAAVCRAVGSGPAAWARIDADASRWCCVLSRRCGSRRGLFGALRKVRLGSVLSGT